MERRLDQRLGDLEATLETGDRQLIALDDRRRELRSTMLRISGALRVLEEELEAVGPGPVGNGLAAKVTERIAELCKEMESGRSLLEELDRQRDDLRDAMLQTGGAIQAIRELLDGAVEG